MPSVRRSHLIAAGLAAVFLTGCDRTHAPVTDYREAYPINVDIKTFSVDVPVDQVGTSQPVPEQFLAEFRRRADGPATVVVPAEGSPEAFAAAQDLAEWLDSRLVPVRIGRALAPGGAPDRLEVFFQGYVALAPNCGDWSGDAGLNPSNRRYPNYGCAYQRNIALMIANPGDLVSPTPSGYANTARSVAIIGKYVEGRATGSEQPVTERGILSEVTSRQN